MENSFFSLMNMTSICPFHYDNWKTTIVYSSLSYIYIFLIFKELHEFHEPRRQLIYLHFLLFDFSVQTVVLLFRYEDGSRSVLTFVCLWWWWSWVPVIAGSFDKASTEVLFICGSSPLLVQCYSNFVSSMNDFHRTSFR